MRKYTNNICCAPFFSALSRGASTATKKDSNERTENQVGLVSQQQTISFSQQQKAAKHELTKAVHNTCDVKRSHNGIDYYLMDPTGNITILVVSPVPVCDQPGVADMLMKQESECEQVGFISDSESSDTRLRMAGGEFCGNATMSTAALFCYRSGIDADHGVSVTVEASGCDTPVSVEITRPQNAEGRYCFRGLVHMPKHRDISRHELTYKDRAYDLSVVDVGGIHHIVTTEPLDMSDEETEEAIKKWCLDLGAEALGIMQVRLGTGDTLDLRPLVYVPGAGTCYWESSCASGTTAVGIYLKVKGLAVSNLRIREPGGELTITEQDGHIILGGTVEIVQTKERIKTPGM